MIKIKLHLLIEHVFWIIHSDSRNKTKLPLLIGVVLIAMFLGGSYLEGWMNAPGVNPPIYYTKHSFASAFFCGPTWIGHSFFLTCAAFVLSFFTSRKPYFPILCGILLLGAAGLCLYQGIKGGFDCFTALTWGIFGALILLGIWTLFFLRGKSKQES